MGKHSLPQCQQCRRFVFHQPGVSPPSRSSSGTHQNLERFEKRRSVSHICHKACPMRGFLSTTQCKTICLSRSNRALRLDQACLFPSLASPTAISRNAALTGTYAILASKIPSWTTPDFRATLLTNDSRFYVLVDSELLDGRFMCGFNSAVGSGRILASSVGSNSVIRFMSHLTIFSCTCLPSRLSYCLLNLIRHSPPADLRPFTLAHSSRRATSLSFLSLQTFQ